MRLSVALLTATLLTGSLVGCTSGYGVPQTSSMSSDSSAQSHLVNGSLITHGAPTADVAPVELRSSSVLAKIHAAARRDQADAVTPGIYASEGTYSSSYIYGYPDPDSSNGPPVCSVGPVQYFRGLAVDRKGDLLVATGLYAGTATITVFKGPGLCGPKLGSFTENPDGNVVGVASRDAQSGKILVENSGRGFNTRGTLAVCTLSAGCTALLKGSHVRNLVAGVALAPNGDCWAWGWTGNSYVLNYFAQCRHRGVAATGLQHSSYSPNQGGLDIDAHGNLVTSDFVYPTVFLSIYSGCNPACKLVGGPFQLTQGGFQHLDASSKQFVGAGSTQLDVYSYSTTGIKYLYSISNGLTGGCCFAAFSPSSKE